MSKQTFDSRLLPESLKKVVPKNMEVEQVLLYISAYQRGVEDTQERLIDRFDKVLSKDRFHSTSASKVRRDYNPIGRGFVEEDEDEDWAPAPDEPNFEMSDAEEPAGAPAAKHDFPPIGHYEADMVKELCEYGMSLVPPAKQQAARSATLRWILSVEPKNRNPPDPRFLQMELQAKGLMEDQVEQGDYNDAVGTGEGDFAN